MATSWVVLTGALVALSYPPASLDWLAWVAFVPLLVALRGARLWRSFVFGVAVWLVPFAGVAVGLVHTDRLIMLGYPLVASTIVGLVTTSYAWLTGRGVRGVWAALAAASLWVVGEALGNVLRTPSSYALSQIGRPSVLQTASLFGGYGLAFLILFVNAAIAEAVVAGRERKDVRGAARLLVPAAAALAASLAWGTARLASVPDTPPPLRVAAVQPLLPSELYTYQWLNPVYRRTARDVVAELSARAAAERPDVLLWPENGNGQLNFQVPALRRAIDELAARSGAALLLSSYETDAEGRFRNAVFSVDPDGRVLGRYAKVALVPGREEGFVAGRGTEPLPTVHGPVGALVCLESCLPGPARELVRKGAELLVVSTSDVGMRNSLPPLFHDAFAVLRAVENGRWLVQTSNGGPSFVVDPFGTVTARTGTLTRDVLFAGVDRRDEQTVYTRLGDWPLGIAIACILGLVFAKALRGAVAQPRRSGLAGTLAVVPVNATLGVAYGFAAVAIVAAGRADLGASWGGAVRRFLEPVAIEIPQDGADAFLQAEPNTCGVAALAFTMNVLGFDVGEADLRALANVGPEGASMADLVGAATASGLAAWGEQQDLVALEAVAKPVIAHLDRKHWVVVLSVAGDEIEMFDPAAGYVTASRTSFAARWDGAVLLARPASYDDASLRRDIQSAGREGTGSHGG